jgi:hypothetical protein
MGMTKPKAAYVYCIVVDDVVRYYGKGTGKRHLSHMRIVRSIARRRAAGETVETNTFYDQLTKAWLSGAIIQTAIVADRQTHRQAFDLEATLIKASDQVWNERRSGKMTAKQRANHLAVMRSAEHRAIKRRVSKRLWKNPGYRAHTISAIKAGNAAPAVRAKRAKSTAAGWRNKKSRKVRCARISAAAQKREANSTRARALAMIRGAADGASHAELCRAIDAPLGLLKNALSVLRQRGLIKKRGGYHGGRFYSTNVALLNIAA